MLPNPIQLVVPLTVLRRSKSYKINYKSSYQQLMQLAKILKVEKVTEFSFSGQCFQSSKHQYALRASLKATLIQNCVISLSPIETEIHHKIDQCFSDKVQESIGNTITVGLNDTEVEMLDYELNIGDIMLESLSLEIPLYPKKKNIIFEGVTAKISGVEPLDQTPNNPFASLKKIFG